MESKYNHTFVKLLGKQKENNNVLIFTLISMIIFGSFLISTALTLGIEHLHFLDGCFLLLSMSLLATIISSLYYKNSIHNFLIRKNSYINFKKDCIEFKNSDKNMYNACYTMETKNIEIVIMENKLTIYKNNKIIYVFNIDSEYINKEYLRSLDYVLFVY